MDRLAVLRHHLAAAGPPPDPALTPAPTATASAFYRPARGGGGALPPVDGAAVEAVLDGPRGAGMKAAVYEVFRAHPELLVPCTEGLTKGGWEGETVDGWAGATTTSRACLGKIKKGGRGWEATWECRPSPFRHEWPAHRGSILTVPPAAWVRHH